MTKAKRDMPIAIELPPPKLPKAKSRAAALRSRRTLREMSDRELTRRQLSNLLRAACGVNRKTRPFGGAGITAASASNSQEVEVYVALRVGAYLFDARRHRLVPVLREDVRGRGDFARPDRRRHERRR